MIRLQSMQRLFFVLVLALLLPAVAGAQTYSIADNQPEEIAAGAPGVTLKISGTLPSTWSSATYGVCFYTGYGASDTILYPTPAGTAATVTLPASSIQQIPFSAFSSGEFDAVLYVADGGTTCTGTPNPALSNSHIVAVSYPAVETLSVSSISDKNSATGAQPPPFALTITGTNFASNATVSYDWSTGNGPGVVYFGADTSLVATVPSGIPSGASGLTVTLCNHAPSNDYCAVPKFISFNSLMASNGSLTAAPNPATVGQSVTLTSKFSVTSGPAGNPSAVTGTVTFNNGVTSLGTSKLILDPTGATTSLIYSSAISAFPQGNLFTKDLNRDGLPDALYIDSTPAIYALLASNPFGSYLPEVSSSPNCGPIISYDLGDVNGDGLIDIVMRCQGAGGPIFEVMTGNGDGTFKNPTDITAGNGTLITLADMDKDGKLDILASGLISSSACGGAAGPCSYGFQIFKGDGAGNFTLSQTIPTSALHFPAGQVMATDVDGDGYLDIVALDNTTQATNSINVFGSNAGASYGTLAGSVYVPTVAIPLTNFPDFYNSMVKADFNGDGLPDFGVMRYPSSGNTQVITSINTSKPGNFSFAATQAITPAVSASSISVGDFNGDGLGDLLVGHSTGYVVYTSIGDGTFGTGYTGLARSGDAGTGPVYAADFNGDGDADVLAINTGTVAAPLLRLRSYVTTGPATATLQKTFSSAGVFSLSAVWPGNVNINGSNGTTSLTVNQLGTSTLVGSSGSPTEYGQPVTFTATVSGGAAGTPTGTVSFMEGPTVLGTGTLVAGVATFNISALNAASHSITAVYSGDANFASSSSSPATQTVNPAATNVAWTPSSPITYGTALGAAHLNATASSKYIASVAGTFNYTPGSGTVLNAGANQILNVTFAPTDTTNFIGTPATANITVTQATPTVNWTSPAPITYGTRLTGTQLNATVTGVGGAAVTGTLAYTPAAATVLNAGNNQNLSVTFTSTDPNYTNTTGGTTITVTKATPTVTWLTPSPIIYGIALSGTQLNAVAKDASGNTVPGIFDYSPSAGTVLNVGPNQPLTVSFIPTSTTNFNNANGNTTITVNQATPTIVWGPPAPITYGTALSATQLNATATGAGGAPVTGTFVYTPVAGTVLNTGPNQNLSVSFTSTDPNYTSTTGGTAITVTRATPTINWTSPAAIFYGTPLSATQLNATVSGVGGANVTGTFAYTPTAGTVLGVGTNQTLSVTFTSTDANYTTATGGTTITVSKATPTVAWGAPAPITYGTPLSATQLNATATGVGGASLPGTFNYTPAVGTVLNAGASQALAVTFTPTDVTNYTNGTGGTTITVNAATPRINWNTPTAITYGTKLSATQLNATAVDGSGGSVPGVFVYTPAAGTLLTAGAGKNLSVSFTPTNATNFNVATGGTTITVNKATPDVNWSAPAAIVVGTPLSATQLNATAADVTGANLPGTFDYSPSAGTVLSVGNGQALNVSFIPTDIANYSNGAGKTTIDVIALALTSITPNTGLIGDAAKTITLTGTGFLANSVVQVNGTGVTTTYNNAISLTAVIPASSFTTVQTLHVTVFNPTQNATSSAVNLSVTAPNPTVIFAGPGTSQPATQPTLTFTLTNPYPAPLTGTLTLTFTGTGGVDDPAIQFAAGGRTLNFTIPANSTQTPTLQFQSGTVAGTITVTMTLNAGGQNVTPAGLQPVTITLPATAPAVSSNALTRSGNTLTVTIHGFSNTRELATATFHFTAADGSSIADPDLTLPVTTLFSTWFTDPTSNQYGSTFTYIQVFNLSADASTIGSVTVTLTNSAGISSISSAQ